MIGEAADLDKQLQILNRTVAMEFSRFLDRSRPAPCERGDQSFGTRRCQSSPCARSSGQGGDQVEENEGSVDPDLAHEETTMFRAVAARRPNTGPTLRSPL